MSFTQSTLLPSQDALLQRLLHLSTYGQQLMVLTGEDGAGKTTLVTALLNELEQYSSALVMCPKHCDSAEIRRKVLVQLLNDPVFDDEIPLPECLLSVSDALPEQSCIVLDDAHWLPLEIWAECIVLSQMTLPGKSIKLLMTAPAEFFTQLAEQLPESLLEQVLAIQIDPLEQAEREGLYYTLLSRSEQQPFTPRDIVKNRLELQQGTPQEVVDLLNLSLNSEPDVAPKKSKLKVIISLAIIALLILLANWLLLGTASSQQLQVAQKVEFAISAEEHFAQDDSFVANYGAKLLSEHKFIDVDAAVAKFEEHQQQAQEQKNVNKSIIQSQTQQVNTYAAVATARFKDTKPAMESNEAPKSEAIKQAVVAKPETDTQAVESALRPKRGYTLQLASVKQLASLNNMLQLLDGIPDVQVARYKQRWVVLNGQFESRQVAQQYAANLVAKTGISEPWIRAWKNLDEYQLQETVATREIQ